MSHSLPCAISASCWTVFQEADIWLGCLFLLFGGKKALYAYQTRLFEPFNTEKSFPCLYLYYPEMPPLTSNNLRMRLWKHHTFFFIPSPEWCSGDYFVQPNEVWWGKIWGLAKLWVERSIPAAQKTEEKLHHCNLEEEQDNGMEYPWQCKPLECNLNWLEREKDVMGESAISHQTKHRIKG